MLSVILPSLRRCHPKYLDRGCSGDALLLHVQVVWQCELNLVHLHGGGGSRGYRFGRALQRTQRQATRHG